MKRTAVVTGASSGIGAAIAIELARKGFNLGLVARRKELLESVSNQCQNEGATTLNYVCDLSESDPKNLRNVINDIASKFGGIDVLINNAGEYVGGNIESLDLVKAEKCLQTNLVSAMRSSQYCAPFLKQSGNGTIIFISSVAGQMPFASGSSYCSSKFGLRGLSGSVFEDLREFGVKVCCICPGYVNTNMPSANLDPAKMIQPSDVAKAVSFVIDFPPTGCPTEITILPQKIPYRTV
jgi:short-subunit dehydrogenase